MPSVAQLRNPSSILKQIISSPSDADYLEQLIPSIREFSQGNKTSQLLEELSKYASEKDTEIERQCSANHQEFVRSVNQLLRIREGTVALTNEILDLNESISASTERLVEQKKALVDSRGVRQNIDEASRSLQDCLEVLRLANQVDELLSQKTYYGALRALDELQSVHLKAVSQYKLSELIQKSVPVTQKKIAEAVMSDLNTWLYRVREMSQYLGELSFYQTDQRRTRLKERAEKDSYLSHFKLNSAIELVGDEHEEYDLLNSDDLAVDFTPLLEALHIYQSLDQMDKFRAEYSNNRKVQKDLLIPASMTLADEEMADLHSLLEDIAGFAIMERATMKRVPDLRTNAEVDELWDALNQSAINLMTKALSSIDNAEHLLKIKNTIALYIQTMQTFHFSTAAMSSFLLVLFDKYAELLKQRFSEDFIEIVSTDDYMPMPIQNAEEFEKVVNVSWYTPDRPVTEMQFPTVFPFSQMYPLCCIDIRNFLNQFYFFNADDFPNPSIIDARLLTSLDDLLSTKVCDILISKLSSQYLGQIVQILINLDHFETACRELETLLIAARTTNNSTTSSTSTSARLLVPQAYLPPTATLASTALFSTHKKTAENRIFELVNQKVSDLIETSEYDFLPPHPPTEPSEYMLGLTRYLSNIMSTVLLSLPSELKDLMLFNAISHTASSVLALPLSEEVKKINPHGVAQLKLDIEELTSYVSTLPTSIILLESLDGLVQTVALLETDSPEEFYDISLRNRKYRNVDPMKGPILLEKLTKEGMAGEGAAGGSNNNGNRKDAYGLLLPRLSGGGAGGNSGSGTGGSNTVSSTGAAMPAAASERFAGFRDRFMTGSGR